VKQRNTNDPSFFPQVPAQHCQITLLHNSSAYTVRLLSHSCCSRKCFWRVSEEQCVCMCVCVCVCGATGCTMASPQGSTHKHAHTHTHPHTHTPTPTPTPTPTHPHPHTHTHTHTNTHLKHAHIPIAVDLIAGGVSGSNLGQVAYELTPLLEELERVLADVQLLRA